MNNMISFLIVKNSGVNSLQKLYINELQNIKFAPKFNADRHIPTKFVICNNCSFQYKVQRSIILYVKAFM